MTVVYYNKNVFQPEFSEKELQLLYVCYADKEQTRMPAAFHSHEHHLELQYISKGGGNIRIGTRVYDVQAGDIVVYNSGMLHDECADPKEGLWFYNCALKCLQLNGLPENHLLEESISPVLHTGRMSGRILALFDALYDQLLEGRMQGGTVCHYLMDALLVMLLYQVPHEPEAQKNKKDSLFFELKGYIDQHYLEELTVEELSTRAHMSISSFAHQFKKRSGFSPIQYIIRRRIGRAQNLLISTDLSITEVSERAGYDNISYFNNQFKKIVGMSPQSYRKYRVGADQYKQLNQIYELWQKK